MHGESRRQSPGQVSNKVADLLLTQIMKVRYTNHVADFHDSCPQLFAGTCRGLCRKVDMMEFGLYTALHAAYYTSALPLAIKML